MHVETQIKNRPTNDVPWYTEADSAYTEVLHAIFRDDKRLINVVYQISEDTLQFTRTMIFSNTDARDAFFADPIIQTLDEQAAKYDRDHSIRVRTITDSN